MAFYQWLLFCVAGFSLSVPHVSSQGLCLNSWIHIQDSCYKISSRSLSWNAAKSACEALGANLAMVTSKAEQQALALKKIPNVWIGLHRNPKDTSRWLLVDGTQASYTHWSQGEPNNHGGYEGCTHMFPPSGLWNDAPCSNSYRYLCETNAKCQKLSLGRGVRVSPSHCLSSNQGYGSTCSFSCTRGYRLSGPSSTQCGKGGVWSRNVNSVSCNDIDECSVTKNGGCSHKCVNTAGGYKCECPDPELSLSPDNRTCHAPGVDVRCSSKNMTIIIPKSLLRGMDREHLRLLDTSCKATEKSAHFSLTTPLSGCNTKSRHTPTAIVYSNAVLEIPVAAEDVVTRVREIEIQFSCFYSKYGVVSSVGWKPSNRKLVFSDEGQGNITLSLNMFPDIRFVSPYMKNDFPVAVVLRKLLFFEVSVTSDDKQLSIMADRCYATPTQDQKNPLKYKFITKGCPNDITVKYHAVPSVSAQRFSLEAFKFIADHPFVFIYCHVIVCNATDSESKCTKTCPSSGRGRREVNDHRRDGAYYLAQGPLHLAREKREERSDSNVDEAGSTPVFMIAAFVMCVACLVGTAFMAYKKSRDKPVGYTVVATSDQK